MPLVEFVIAILPYSREFASIRGSEKTFAVNQFCCTYFSS